MAGTVSRRRGAAPSPALVPDLPEVVVTWGTVATGEHLDDADVLVLPLAPAAEGDDGVQPRSGTADAAVRYGVDLAEAAERLGHEGAAGDVRSLVLPRAIAGGTLPWDGLPDRVLLAGLGDGSAADLRSTGAAVARATRGRRRVVTTVASDAGPEGTRAFVEGYLLGSYSHPTQAASSGPGPAGALVLLGRHAEDAVRAARRAVHATWVARVLTATPSSTKSPAWLADRAAELARAAGLEVEVLGPDELEARGFGGILAVGAGSATPPRLVTVRYEPPTDGRRLPRHVVVAGKGITYDTGGISIKPRESMVAMKTDMAGAAVALATVLGAAAEGLPHRVTALLPLAENAVGASSYRPGDVIRVYGGTSVEIANTDAEGRIVLADALAHADRDLDPDVLVDVATLTGAATLGLGRTHGALYATDDRLARALVLAGEESGERLWPMPLVDEYREAVDSTVADVRHVPADGFVGAGSITAALFLQRFVGARPWAHLDIAGPARATSGSATGPEGATGFGARVLLRWLAGLG